MASWVDLVFAESGGYDFPLYVVSLDVPAAAY